MARRVRLPVDPLSYFVSCQLLLCFMGLLLAFFSTPAAAMDTGEGDSGGRSLLSRIPPFSGKKADYVMWII